MHGKNSKMLEKYCKIDRKCEKKVKSCSKKKKEKKFQHKKNTKIKSTFQSQEILQNICFHNKQKQKIKRKNKIRNVGENFQRFIGKKKGK